jgi:hypothetical protein
MNREMRTVVLIGAMFIVAFFARIGAWGSDAAVQSRLQSKVRHAREALREHLPELSDEEQRLCEKYIALQEAQLSQNGRKAIDGANDLYDAFIRHQQGKEKSRKPNVLWRVFNFSDDALPYIAANTAMFSRDLTDDAKLVELKKQLVRTEYSHKVGRHIVTLLEEHERYTEVIDYLSSLLKKDMSDYNKAEYRLLLCGAYLARHSMDFKEARKQWRQGHPDSGATTKGMQYKTEDWVRAAKIARNEISRQPRLVEGYFGLFECRGPLINPENRRELYQAFLYCANRTVNTNDKERIRGKIERALKELPAELEVFD